MEKITQKERVLGYIKKWGSITSLEAFVALGCTRLSAQIYDLKKDGYTFTDKSETHANRYGDKVSYKRYFLEENDNAGVDKVTP